MNTTDKHRPLANFFQVIVDNPRAIVSLSLLVMGLTLSIRAPLR
jgi:hypothetical protein